MRRLQIPIVVDKCMNKIKHLYICLQLDIPLDAFLMLHLKTSGNLQPCCFYLFTQGALGGWTIVAPAIVKQSAPQDTEEQLITLVLGYSGI